MRVAILVNRERSAQPGREARNAVLRTAQAVQRALAADGIRAPCIAAGARLSTFLARVERYRPDLVFNLCESLLSDARGEQAIPALLTAMKIRSTGSPALALGLALDKVRAKEVLRAHRVPTPDSARVDTLPASGELSAMGFPAIVKPSREDASVGIDDRSVVRDGASYRRAVRRVLRTYRQPALVERYVDGRELYVPILENSPRPLPITEVEFRAATFAKRPRIVSYRAKWVPGSREFRDTATAPAKLSAAVEARCRAVAEAAFAALGCRSYGRVDLRLDAAGRPWVLEVNPNCDLDPDAGFPRAALAAGISYRDLVRHLLREAYGNSSDD